MDGIVLMEGIKRGKSAAGSSKPNFIHTNGRKYDIICGMKVIRFYLLCLAMGLGSFVGVAFGATVSVTQAENCTLKVTVNGKENTTKNPTITLDSGTLKVECVPAAGYYFQYWITSISKYTLQAINPLTISAKDLTVAANALYPQLGEVSYYHAFERGNSAAVGTMEKSGLVKYFSGAKLPECGYTLKNYRFVGWEYNGKVYAAGETVSKMSATQGATVTFTAKWQQDGVTVHFDKNLSAAEISLTEKTYSVGGSYGAVPSPICEGYEFVEWNTKANGSGETWSWAKQVLVTDGVEFTLYAIWSPHTYTVRFDKGDTLQAGTMENQEFVYGVAQKLSKNQFTKENVDFLYWKSEDEKTTYEDEEVVSNLSSRDKSYVTLTAVWAETYYVAFEGGGATNGVMGVKRVESAAEEWVLTANAYRREGQTFMHWASSDGKTYTDGQVVKGLAEPGKTNVMTAVWQTNAFDIVFHANAKYYKGETATIHGQIYNEAVCLPECGTTNFVGKFLGWAWKPESAAADWKAGEMVEGLSTRMGDVVHLHAIWEKVDSIYSQAFGCEDVLFTSMGDEDVEAWTVAGGVASSGAGSQSIVSRLESNILDPGLFVFEWRLAEGADVSQIDFRYNNGVTIDAYQKVGEVPTTEWGQVQVYLPSERAKPYWSSAANEAGTLSVRNVKWYPLCSTNHAEICYNENADGAGRGGVITQKVYAVEGTGKIRAALFSREGFDFEKWTTAADGTGEEYAAGQEVVCTNLMLYAQWKEEGQGGGGDEEDVDFATALGCSNLTFTTSDDAHAWKVCAGGQGLQSSAADNSMDGENSVLTTTLESAGTLTFVWKMSADSNARNFKFRVVSDQTNVVTTEETTCTYTNTEAGTTVSWISKDPNGKLLYLQSVKWEPSGTP